MSRRERGGKVAGEGPAAGGGGVEGTASSCEVASALVPLLRTIRHFFPGLAGWLRSVHDGRRPDRIIYPIAFELWTALFLFWSKLSARRQIRFQFNTAPCLRTLNYLAGSQMPRMMAIDTLPYGIARLGAEELPQIQHALVEKLLRQKSLSFARLLGRYYLLAIDMTGYQTFQQRHCAHCLTQEHEGRTLYLHHALDAKLVTPNGMALSVATEFVENVSAQETRQDCELKAFYRLAPRLKKLFPQLSICLLLDGLYAVKPVLDVCRDLNWKYIVTFKEGRAPEAFGEYEALRDLAGNRVQGLYEDRPQTLRWINGLPYGSHQVSVLECQETSATGEVKRFVWMTNISIDAKNCRAIGNEGGRQRWRIEEGFNIQKNGGYGLEHAYSEDEALMKRFYLLLQIAHTIYQVLEKGLLREKVATVFGSIRNVARRFLEEIRTCGLGVELFERWATQRIQIRFNTS
jgi:hypothetical protein